MHGHAHGHMCPAALFYLDSGMAMRTAMTDCMFFWLIWHGHAHGHAWMWIFQADLAWPCARTCLKMNFHNAKHTTSCVGAYVGAQHDHTSNTHQIKSSFHVNHLIST